MKQPDWKEFEKECVRYLNNKYGNICKFTGSGGSNPNTPDIEVKKNNGNIFNIEVKEPAAQCGQFVLQADFFKDCYVWSNRNKSNRDSALKIVEYMNKHFDNFQDPGTAGSKQPLPQELMYEWVKNYYGIEKNSPYVISKYGDHYVIIPTNKFEQYFGISGKIRVKMSGSGEPSKKNESDFKYALEKNNITYSEITYIEIKNPGKKKKTKCYIKLNSIEDKIKVKGNNYRYQFNKEGNQYEVRKLANTANTTVIFSISLKRDQVVADLKEFEARLK